jgi:hypothetical protein
VVIEDPFPAVVQIRGHVAFYPERVDEIAEQFANRLDANVTRQNDPDDFSRIFRSVLISNGSYRRPGLSSQRRSICPKL